MTRCAPKRTAESRAIASRPRTTSLSAGRSSVGPPTCAPCCIATARSNRRGRAGARALARVRQAGAFEDPMVALDVAPLSIGSSERPLRLTRTVSQRLPWFGKLSLEESAARAEADAQRSDYEATRRELALSASLLYDEYFVAVRSLEINAHHVELMRVDARRRPSRSSKPGARRRRTRCRPRRSSTHMEHDAVVLASQRDVDRRADERALASRPRACRLPAAAEELCRRTPRSVAPDWTARRARRIDRRPEIAAARQRARAEQARADRAERESYPDLTVSTSYNSMWDMPEHRWMVGLGFNLPVQTGRRARRRGRGERHARAVRERGGAHERHGAHPGLRRAEAARGGRAAFSTSSRSGCCRSRASEIDAARAAFIASQVPFVAVVDAEKNLRSVELDYQMARADCDRRRGELDRALGRIPGLDGKEDAPMSLRNRSAARTPTRLDRARRARLAAIALVFRRPLVAWFSGASTTAAALGAGAPSAATPRRTRAARSITTPARCTRP